MVNIFSAEQRRNYNLESLWRRAEKMDISDCISEAAEEVTVDGNESIDDWLGE